ncbi:MAG: DUF1571 domain-containing protein [Phycisphaerales bacterium]|nr:DUF1571 domain-containing protein [Phycisphaerales bacterium]
MPRDPKKNTRRRIQILFGLFLAGLLYVEFEFNQDYEPVVSKGIPVVLAAEPVDTNSFESLLRNKPLDALKDARDRLVRENRDYGCTFVKQERMPKGMSAEQEVEVLFRPEPYSVMMNWIRNPGMAQRVIYVKGKWVDETAESAELREQAWCKPIKPLDLIVPKIKRPIHGPLAKKSSRRSIDQFGFKRALDLLVHYSDLAEARNELDLAFKGETHFDGRPVWVIRRRLPYTGENGKYPDRIADIYIDKDYHVPVAVYCYSQDGAKPRDLLGKYEYRNVRFDLDLTDANFEPATYGM